MSLATPARDGRRRHPRPASAAASPATASTPPGRCRTSRRCSTTTRCSRAPTCTAGRPRATSGCARSAVDTLEWALREMRAPEGGFYSALDADSEGVEGRYYVWTRRRAARAARATTPTRAIAWLGASEQGNFVDPHHPAPGLNVLQDRGPRPPPRACASASARGCSRRARARVRPGLDDKRLTSWNALMISALADAGAALGGAALSRRRRSRCAEFVAARAARRARAAAAQLQPRRGAASTPTWRTTRSCWRR